MTNCPISKAPTSSLFPPNNLSLNKSSISKNQEEEFFSSSSSLIEKSRLRHVKILSSGVIHPVSGISSFYSSLYPEELLSDTIEDYEFNNLLSQINLSSQSYWPCLTCYCLSYALSLATCGCCCGSFCLNGNFLGCVKQKSDDYTPKSLSTGSESYSSSSSLFLCFSRPPTYSLVSSSTSTSSSLPCSLFSSACIYINNFVSENLLNNFLFSSLTGSSSAIEITKNLHHFLLKSNIRQKKVEIRLVPASLFYRLHLHSLFQPLELSSSSSSTFSYFESFFLPSYLEILFPYDQEETDEDIESNVTPLSLTSASSASSASPTSLTSSSTSTSSSSSSVHATSPSPLSDSFQPRLRKNLSNNI